MSYHFALIALYPALYFLLSLPSIISHSYIQLLSTSAPILSVSSLDLPLWALSSCISFLVFTDDFYSTILSHSFHCFYLFSLSSSFPTCSEFPEYIHYLISIFNGIETIPLNSHQNPRPRYHSHQSSFIVLIVSLVFSHLSVIKITQTRQCLLTNLQTYKPIFIEYFTFTSPLPLLLSFLDIETPSQILSFLS